MDNSKITVQSGNQDSIEAAEVKSKRRKKYWLPVLAAIIVLTIVSAFCVGGVVMNWTRSAGAHAIRRPVAVFGLRPSEAAYAELISEKVTATEMEALSRTDEFYAMEMQYEVKNEKDLMFSIPCPVWFSDYTLEAQQPMEIFVDRKPVEYTSEIIPMVSTNRPLGNTIKQTVWIFPLMACMDIQPANTYEFLCSGYGKELQTFDADSNFLLYEITDKSKNFKLEMTGRMDQLRLVFREGMDIDNEYHRELQYIDEANNIGAVTYTDYSKKKRQSTTLFAVPENSGELTVKFNGKEVPPTVMKLSDILALSGIVDDSDDTYAIQSYIEKLNLYTGPIKPAGEAYVVDGRSLNRTPYGAHVEMYEFRVPRGAYHYRQTAGLRLRQVK